MPTKRISYLIVVTVFFLFSISPVPGFAFNVNVLQGNATVSTSGNTVTINASSRAILQGNTSIPANVTVKVVQGLNDILLRDTTGSVTNILGSLLSNGNIILVNSVGVYIGQSANVNVGSLIASTLDIKNAMFMNGNYQFTKIPGLNPAQILNDANIKVANGGYVILLADSIVNKGTITAYMGTVALGSGQQATVSFDQGGLVNLVIDQGLARQLTNSNGQPKAQIVNSGGIYANGGKVQMSAQLLNTALNQVINNTGIIEANNVVEHGGTIELTASGAIDNSGIIQAGTMNEQGETFNSDGILDVGHGFYTNLDDAINISGSISGLNSDTGNINFTGAVSLAGDTTLQADDTGSQTGEVVMNTYSLTGNNYNLTLYTGVNDTLDGSITGVNLLTLNSSTSNNKTFTSTGASFSVNTLKTNYYSLFSRSQGSGTSGSPYMIYSDSDAVGGLQYIPTESLSAHYELANNIDATETSSWNSGAGFVPISTFTGTFNGNNYMISNLFIDLPSTNYVGLFGHATGATIENVGLTSADITGQEYVGGLIGNADSSSTISNSYVTGSVTGVVGYLGGLVGESDSSSISNSYAMASVSGSGPTGGLVGRNHDSSISDSYATGSVTQTSGGNNAGGLVGYNDASSSISNSYATGAVTSSGTNIGGLVGYNDASSISNSDATGSIAGGGYLGGLVGYNDVSSTISNSYATGALTGGGPMGGLVGYNDSASITDSYATGTVTESSGSSNAGGLVGMNVSSASITNSYATGLVTSAGNNLGGLVGYNDSSTISDSYSTGSVAGSGSGGYIGGLVGYNVSSTISNSYSTGSVAGGGPIGGLVGLNDASSISDSYATGSVTEASGSSNAGGLVGFNESSSSVINSFATGTVTSSGSNIGGLIGYDDSSNTLTNNWWYNSLSNGIGNYGPNTSTGHWQEAGGVSDFFNPSQAVYNGTSPWDIASTTGHTWAMSGDDDAFPLLQFRYSTAISDDYQLQLMFLNLGASYSLANNIDASDTSNWNDGNGFAPIGISSPFTGTFNGNNYTISNLFIDLPSTNYVGLFGHATGATIENVGLTSANITGQEYVGGLVGYIDSSSTISNSNVAGTVTGVVGYLGGLVGKSDSSNISNSYVTGSVTGSGPTGGLVGQSDSSSSISYSYATASVTQTSGGNYVGGLVGQNDSSSSISNSYATGTVTSSGDNLGGLVGYNDSSSISDSYATGSVVGSGSGGYTGGLVGYSVSSTISNSYATGAVSGGGPMGGLVGYNDSTAISDSYATGTVTESSGSSNAGGLVGMNVSSASITNSYATGTVTSNGNNLGGLVGYNDSSTVAASYATGSVVGSAGGGYEGGLVGWNVSSGISNSYATGAVSGGGPIGGLAGLNDASSISDSYATGSVTEASGNDNAGGLVGKNVSSSSVINSFATGSVTSSGTDVGGLIGYDDGTNTLTNNWWYNATNSYAIGNTMVVGNKAGAASDFYSSGQAVYTGSSPWDFSTVWYAPSGTYPQLR